MGPAVAAAAATLTAASLSRREVARLLGDLLGVRISAASVEALVKQTADALKDTYVEVLAAVDPARFAVLMRPAGSGRARRTGCRRDREQAALFSAL